jgi:hypothetical protein
MPVPRQRHCRQSQLSPAHKHAPPSPPGFRIAVFGGDTQQEGQWSGSAGAGSIRFFSDGRRKGDGELRSLLAAVRARSFDLVVILACWNGHSATRVVRRLCHRTGVDVVVVR